jgi:hypothetical protein
MNQNFKYEKIHFSRIKHRPLFLEDQWRSILPHLDLNDQLKMTMLEQLCHIPYPRAFYQHWTKLEQSLRRCREPATFHLIIAHQGGVAN